MKAVYVSILVIVAILWLCAKILKPDIPVTENSYSKIFLIPAAQICKWMSKISAGAKFTGGSLVRNRLKDQKLNHNLHILYPGDSAESRMYRYRVELISTILLVITAGSAMCLTVSYLSDSEGVLTDGNLIYRNTYGGAEVAADLSAGIERSDNVSEEYEVDLTVPARVYSQEDADILFEQLSDDIDQILLNDNDSADHILYPLRFVTAVDGYPFTISWESSDYEIIDYDGAVNNLDMIKPQIVTVTGDCLYQGKHRYLIRDLYVCPRELTEEERIHEEILSAVKKAESDSASDDHVTLPLSVSAGSLTWKENLSDISPMILMGVLLISVLIVPFRESEVNKQLKKRSRELLIEYPSFVSQLTLFLGAGLSVRNCLIGMGRKAASRKSGSNTYLDKELIITSHEIEVGISESEAIEHFGKRCGTREYMRFSALLNQNMKKGSADLIAMLKEESDDAFVLRKNEARKLGEEASTKMLLPMVMMLTVVMIIIMVPAYMSFSS